MMNDTLTKGETMNQAVKDQKQVEFEKRSLERREQDVRDGIHEALATMERYIRDAKLNLARPETGQFPTTLFDKVDSVMRQLAWGHANATSSLSTALKYAVEADRLRVHIQTLEAE
jgi:hypothetical protein